jgi:hypothetical protein
VYAPVGGSHLPPWVVPPQWATMMASLLLVVSLEAPLEQVQNKYEDPPALDASHLFIT